MNTLLEQIEKAKARQGGEDLQELAERSRDKTPRQLESSAHLAQRRRFLRESLGSARESLETFERIIDGNEIQDVNYLARGVRAANAVARIAIRAASGRQLGWGTGFLVAPGVLLTNNHVLPDAELARRSEAQFGYELDVDGNPLDFVTFALEPQHLFYTSVQLDFSVVAVRRLADNASQTVDTYGCLPLVATLGKVSEGEWLTIIQHPRGGRKQLCIRENQLIKRDDDVLWYSTDTLSGSSGSPVFNNDWYVIALHHSGVPDERDGRIQTLAGRDYDPQRDKEEDIRWIANEGIRVSRIVETLRQAHPGHTLLQPVFNATPRSARIEPSPQRIAQAVLRLPQLPPLASPPPAVPELAGEPAMPLSPVSTLRQVNVRFGIDEAGAVHLVDAVPVRENAPVAEPLRARRPPDVDVPFDATYDDRKGYDTDFLMAEMGSAGNEREADQPEESESTMRVSARSKARPNDADKKRPASLLRRVHLPQLSDELASEAAELAKKYRNGSDPNVLKYHNYSVVMHAKRRFAIYTAANVDFGQRYDLARPADVWRTDPRIAQSAQISNFYYANNQFDRGHLTRREDLEFGATRAAALASAADTCHWTNCTPQHARFNQSRELWQGIERYLLEETIRPKALRAQVITGPVLDEGDPVWQRFDKIQYPVRYWKVVAALNDAGELFATAYLLDQREVIDRYGIEADEPFGAYRMFQVPIAEIERLTDLSFPCETSDGKKKSLSDFDPLANKSVRRRLRHSGSVLEAVMAMKLPENYVPLESLDSIVRE